MSILDVTHVTLSPRLSPFSACNIEKVGGPGDEASMMAGTKYIRILYAFTKILAQLLTQICYYTLYI